MSHTVYVFDAYGTLFDVHAAVRRHAEAVGPDGQQLSEIWRAKQLEYSWVRSLMGRYQDFWSLTEQALDFAFRAVPSADTSVIPLPPHPPSRRRRGTRGGEEMNSISKDNLQSPRFSTPTREDTMIGHRPKSFSRLIFVSTLAIALASVAVQAQAQTPSYAMAACISKDEKAHEVLTAAAAMNLSLRMDLQTVKTCADFCRTGTSHEKPRCGATSPNSEPASPTGTPCLRVATGVTAAIRLAEQRSHGEACAGKSNCLLSPTERCYVPQERDHMVIDLEPPPGTAVTGGGGGVSSGGGAAPTTQPPPATGNQRPRAPTVQAGGYDPPFPIGYEGAYQMTWRNNGDPDGDVLTFGLIIWQYDWSRRMWMQMPGIRDQYGTYGMVWLRDDNYTFTMANGLSPRTHYAWMVFACDLDKGDAALCSWSGWGLFRTQ